MNRKLLLAAAIAALAAPALAHADEVVQNVTIGGEVEKACKLGAPTTYTLAIGDLTDNTNGRLKAALTSGVVVSTDIEGTWCNTPGELTIAATPLTLATAPGYSTPAGFSRYVAYSADIDGWETALGVRAYVGSGEVSADSSAALAPELELKISALGALAADGTDSAANNTLVLEAGSYNGQVTLTIKAK